MEPEHHASGILLAGFVASAAQLTFVSDPWTLFLELCSRANALDLNAGPDPGKWFKTSRKRRRDFIVHGTVTYVPSEVTIALPFRASLPTCSTRDYGNSLKVSPRGPRFDRL